MKAVIIRSPNSLDFLWEVCNDDNTFAASGTYRRDFCSTYQEAFERLQMTFTSLKVDDCQFVARVSFKSLTDIV